MNESLHRVIGIDLGTTYSAVAAYDRFNERAEIILNHDEVDYVATTPSVVGLSPQTGRAIVGAFAKRNLPLDPENTIVEIKREMGEVFDEENIDRFHARGEPFKTKEKDPKGEGDPVKVRLGSYWYMAQEISALILMKMKAIAEKEIGEEIRDAVITVPAYFTEKQKKATQQAALLAGLYPRQLIPEPTAAAICYGLDCLDPVRHTYLVYDLGGGTFDVSIITVEESKIGVVATSGDMRLGGGDFDDAIVEWAVEELKAKHGIDLSGDRGAKIKLKLHAEVTKVILSTAMTAKLSLDMLDPGQQGLTSLDLTREKFNELIEPFLTRSLTFVDKALEAAKAKQNLEREDIDAILLVGGSSKIPKVRECLLGYFKKDDNFLRAELNPDEVVARGAAALAFRFAPSPPPFDIGRSMDASLVNAEAGELVPPPYLITEHTLGVAVQDNRFAKILQQGTHIPVSITDDNYTNGGPFSDVDVRVYQGEGQYCYENTLIGVLHLGPMEPRPEGFHKFAVTFSLDVNGLLSTTVNHINEGKTYQKRFDQSALARPGDLSAMRSKLLALYDSTAVMPESAAPVDFIPPPPGPPAAPPAQPDEAAVPQAAEQAPVATQSEPAPPPPKVEIIEPQVEVPEQFKSLVRRAEKLLLANPNAALLEMFNAFTSALNAGKDEDDLIDMSDDLENAYHDARLKARE